MIKQVGDRIRAIRESRKLTQANMAEELGMQDSSGYAKIERGENTTLKRLFQIADILEVEIAVFFIDVVEEIKDNQTKYGFTTKEEFLELNKIVQSLLSLVEKLDKKVDSIAPKKSPKRKK